MPTAKKITSLFPKSKAGKDAKGKGAKGAKRAAAAIGASLPRRRPVARQFASLRDPRSRRHRSLTTTLPHPNHRAVEEEAEDESETYLKILKTFDMSTEYGPALGLTRLERWKRAEGFGLHPPADVHKILTERDTDGTLAKCVWENIV